MKETPEQYVGRLLGYLGARDPLPILEATPATLARLVDGWDEGRLRTRPTPEHWSMAEIAIHLAEVEIVVGYRVRCMLGGKDGDPIQAFDQDRWSTRYDRAAVPVALAMHRGLRDANLALYRSLSPQEWARYGMHSERGKESVEHTVRLAAGHDLNHIAQMKALRPSPEAPPGGRTG
jgi:hypothetical protein